MLCASDQYGLPRRRMEPVVARLSCEQQPVAKAPDERRDAAALDHAIELVSMQYQQPLAACRRMHDCRSISIPAKLVPASERKS